MPFLAASYLIPPILIAPSLSFLRQFLLHWNSSVISHSLLIDLRSHRPALPDELAQQLEIMNIEGLSLSQTSQQAVVGCRPQSGERTRTDQINEHTGVKVLKNRASSSVSLENV